MTQRLASASAALDIVARTSREAGAVVVAHFASPVALLLLLARLLNLTECLSSHYSMTKRSEQQQVSSTLVSNNKWRYAAAAANKEREQGQEDRL